jgi:hypothetical protein
MGRVQSEGLHARIWGVRQRLLPVLPHGAMGLEHVEVDMRRILLKARGTRRCHVPATL